MHDKFNRTVATTSHAGMQQWLDTRLGVLVTVTSDMGCVPTDRQRVQALQGSSGAVHSTYAGYIQQLQQSGASTSNRLALHAGRRNTVMCTHSQSLTYLQTLTLTHPQSLTYLYCALMQPCAHTSRL